MSSTIPFWPASDVSVLSIIITNATEIVQSLPRSEMSPRLVYSMFLSCSSIMVFSFTKRRGKPFPPIVRPYRATFSFPYSNAVLFTTVIVVIIIAQLSSSTSFPLIYLLCHLFPVHLVLCLRIVLQLFYFFSSVFKVTFSLFPLSFSPFSPKTDFFFVRQLSAIE